MKSLLYLLLSLTPLGLGGSLFGVFSVKKSNVSFTSDAPLEVIRASSDGLKGLIDNDEHTFAFTIDLTTFQGFNSSLQREHFNENYLETYTHRKASFSGKLIEKVDFTKDGTYTVRAKGKLQLHGVTNERIIKSEVTVKGGKFRLRSNFTVLLAEHDISIPKIVHQKIAEEIQVAVDAEFENKG
ncbi:MAG: YceI family protein [Saprospiraceae bacterium]|nr:YceI family protein [Saprospiraceae bacterium]